MAPTNVPVTTISGADAGVTWPAADGTAIDTVNGNSCANSPTLCVMVTNTSGTTPYTIDFITTATAGGYAIANPQKTLAANEKKVYGPFPDELFGSTLEWTGVNAAVKVIPFQVLKS